MTTPLEHTAELPAADPTAPPVVLATPSASMSRGLRETIESIAIAFALAFLFKAFQAEAFVIPTGSMAPTLMGRHKDVVCPECGFRYSTSGSDEAERDGSEKRDRNSQVVRCTCPVCRLPLSVDPEDDRNAGRNAKPSYSGDRIWVSKVAYELFDPRRWDVIVFRFPEEAETYYIKRLVGLPNESLRIYHGDIFTKGAQVNDFVIERKPPDKVRSMAQIVHDNDCVSPTLVEQSWPTRWQVWNREEVPGMWQGSPESRSFSTDGTSPDNQWIRYQHTVPSATNWGDEGWSDNPLPRPQLITDFYAFNTQELRGDRGPMPKTLGLHWVGDLLVECELNIESNTGTALVDLVKGGRHFTCAFDVATGRAQLSIDGVDNWHPTAETSVRGIGKHKIMLANVDQQLLLWVNDKLVSFDSPTTYEALGNENPQSPNGDDGDLAPVGIGTRGAVLTVEHLRVLRDIYYIANNSASFLNVISDFRSTDPPLQLSADELADFFASPKRWVNARGDNVFDRRQSVTFDLGPDQFFVLGDNSPASSDARLWARQHFVDRELLVGKALFVYWPHPLNLPIPFTEKSIGVIPNFPSMGFIR